MFYEANHERQPRKNRELAAAMQEMEGASGGRIKGRKEGGVKEVPWLSLIPLGSGYITSKMLG